MEEVKVNLWNPHLRQREITTNNARFKVIVTGRRFGKTLMAVKTLIKKALVQDEAKFFYAAPTYKQAKMIAWEMLLKSCRELPNQLVKKINESELYVVLGNNSRIDIKGADDPDKLRGVGLDGCILDEYADIKENVWTEIVQPALADRQGFCWFVGTPRGFNHFWRLYEDAEQLDNWSRHRYTSYDNPHLNKEELDRIRKETPEDTFAQEYLAEFRRFEGLVYREFDPENHVVEASDTPEAFQKVICGVDFGFTNPTAVVVIGCESNGRYWILDEWYETQTTTDELIQQLKTFAKRYGIQTYYPDPAEPDRILEMRRASLNCREVSKEIVSGIDRIRELFKSGRITVLRNCRNLITELGTYRYPESKDQVNPKEVPIKDMDHLCDALRYALYAIDPGNRVVKAKPVIHSYRKQHGNIKQAANRISRYI